jgi:hypothetical protein
MDARQPEPTRASGWIRWLPGIATLRSYEARWLVRDLGAGLVLTTALAPVGIGGRSPATDCHARQERCSCCPPSLGPIASAVTLHSLLFRPFLMDPAFRRRPQASSRNSARSIRDLSATTEGYKDGICDRFEDQIETVLAPIEEEVHRRRQARAPSVRFDPQAVKIPTKQ